MVGDNDLGCRSWSFGIADSLPYGLGWYPGQGYSVMLIGKILCTWIT